MYNGEVREEKRDIAVTFYDYQKAHDKVHHYWIVMVYEWMGIPKKEINVLQKLMNDWNIRLEVNIRD